jgi:hypothetical protein
MWNLWWAKWSWGTLVFVCQFYGGPSGAGSLWFCVPVFIQILHSMLPTHRLGLGGLFEIAVPTDSVSGNNNVYLSRFRSVNVTVLNTHRPVRTLS